MREYKDAYGNKWTSVELDSNRIAHYKNGQLVIVVAK